ncbi:YncE family protein [Klebsiella sp. FR21MBA2675]|uniref:YncE family protein n=1 Tax=Klebsiella sp. FR21MBA2675 TaxID=3381300 RepID=UPI003A96D98A
MSKQIYGRFPVKLLLVTLLMGSAASSYADTDVLRKPVGIGAYELVFNASHPSLLVATTQNRNDQGGVVYELDAKTLAVMHAIKTGKKPFGAAINNRTHTAYFGGSIEGCLIAVDTETGQVKGILTLVPQSHTAGKPENREGKKPEGKEQKPANGNHKGNDNRPPAPRELTVDDQTNTVYVSGVNRNDSLIWVVDGATLTLKDTLHGFGIMNTGLAIDSENHRLYTSNASGEFITLDTASNKIVARKTITTDGQAHLLMNISLDKKGHRAFIADNKADTILVVDTNSSDVIGHINVPESLSVLYNPQRNEIYAAHRNNGTVSIINGTTFAVAKTIRLPVHPNSLALNPQGDALYVTVKQESNRNNPTTAPDDVVRIDLK